MKDFWLSCGHHLLDRDAGDGLVVTDEFLKVYLARPELAPPPDAAADERALHAKYEAVAAFRSQLSTFFRDRADLEAQVGGYLMSTGGERRWRRLPMVK